MKTNEYGAELDRNGYAPSLMKNRTSGCHICGRKDRRLERHEVLHGSNREKSKQLGLWIEVCDSCHKVIHFGNGELDKCQKREAEEIALKHYGWTQVEFIYRFGKNYL